MCRTACPCLWRRTPLPAAAQKGARCPRWPAPAAGKGPPWRARTAAPATCTSAAPPPTLECGSRHVPGAGHCLRLPLLALLAPKPMWHSVGAYSAGPRPARLINRSSSATTCATCTSCSERSRQNTFWTQVRPLSSHTPRPCACRSPSCDLLCRGCAGGRQRRAGAVPWGRGTARRSSASAPAASSPPTHCSGCTAAPQGQTPASPRCCSSCCGPMPPWLAWSQTPPTMPCCRRTLPGAQQGVVQEQEGGAGRDARVMPCSVVPCLATPSRASPAGTH